jgi:outer membrane protein TolC
MKNKLSLIMAGLAVTGLLSVALPACFAQQTTPPPASGTTPHYERHPEIRHAIRALEAAKRDLQAASHDFGGHRADALTACDNAIAQLKTALQYDKN